MELIWLLLHRLGVPLLPILPDEPPALPAPLPPCAPLLCTRRGQCVQLHHGRVNQLPDLRTWSRYAQDAGRPIGCRQERLGRSRCLPCPVHRDVRVLGTLDVWYP